MLVELGKVAGVFSADAVAITATFATNVNTIVSQVKGALQSFATLGDAKVGGDVLKAFIASAQSLVQQMTPTCRRVLRLSGGNTVVGLINGIVSQRSALTGWGSWRPSLPRARPWALPGQGVRADRAYAGAGLQGSMAAAMQPANCAATRCGPGHGGRERDHQRAAPEQRRHDE